MQIHTRLTLHDLKVGIHCNYRLLNHAAVGDQFIDGRIVAVETTMKGVVTLVRFVSTMDRKTYSVSPHNLYY